MKWDGHNRRIPRRVECTGDIDYARSKVGVADSQLTQLENLMSFRSLKVGSDTRRYRDNDREYVVEVWSNFNLQGVRIHAFEPEAEEKEEKKKKCFCSCHVSTGTISVPKRTMGTCWAEGAEYSTCYKHLSMFGEEVLYDVEICSGDSFVTITDCPASDYTKYTDDQEVMVLWMPDDGQTYDEHGNGCSIKQCMLIPFEPFETPELKDEL